MGISQGRDAEDPLTQLRPDGLTGALNSVRLRTAKEDPPFPSASNAAVR